MQQLARSAHPSTPCTLHSVNTGLAQPRGPLQAAGQAAAPGVRGRPLGGLQAFPAGGESKSFLI